MSLPLSPSEYRRLIELVYLGVGVLGGKRPEESEVLRRYDKMVEKLLRAADSHGCADCVTVSPEGSLMPSTKITEDAKLRSGVGESTNDIFWHELIARLSDRDLAAEQAREALADQDGPPLDAEVRLKEIEDAYWAEFEKFDLAHVVLLRGAKG